ncbi:MAG: hypothetical protein C5S49_07180 [Candidatus Methanogaster sp.]|nr:MAG: hypothetical protein C5S49_07180 [ANME-2 cluster archaeon]
MIVSLSIVLLEDYYSNNIEVLWSRVSFRSIWNDGGMGGYVGELNTYLFSYILSLYYTLKHKACALQFRPFTHNPCSDILPHNFPP